MSDVLSAFVEHARNSPDRPALVLAEHGRAAVAERATYGQLYARVQAFAAGLVTIGFRPGDTLILASPLSVDFYALAIAVVASRMQLVLIDGRLDRRRLLSALRSADADAIVSVPEALRRWPAVPPLWRMRRYAATGRGGFGVRPLDALRGESTDCRTLAGGPPGEPAIISFTSGSTGRAKGVVRTNAILSAQHQALSAHLPYEPGDVDMTCLPAVVLHNLACAVTTVLPPVDLRQPATIDPAAAVAVMRSEHVTTLSGAPAFIGRIARHVAGSPGAGAGIGALKRVVVGGAPVTPALCGQLARAFPDAAVVAVYGSTEAEPIAHIGGAEVQAQDGLLVGAPVVETEVELVSLPERLDRRVPPEWLRERRVPDGEAGEVVVRGAGVSREYVGDPEAVARNKVRVEDGSVWHRTGDVARRDEDGRLWLLGRAADELSIDGHSVYPLALEARLEALPGVGRAAVVGTDGRVTVAVEPSAGPEAARDAVRETLAAAGLSGAELVTVDAIPVDARHQSKVDRAALARMLGAGG